MNDDLKEGAVIRGSKPRLLSILGPGLITGASDDEPSGIATYSQVDAQFGYALSWTMLLSLPLMAVIQDENQDRYIRRDDLLGLGGARDQLRRRLRCTPAGSRISKPRAKLQRR